MKAPCRCLVFGGSGALGRETCEILSSRGAKVAFTYRNRREVADELAERLPGAIPFHLDVTHVPDIGIVVDKASDALGGIDAFIDCSAVFLSPQPSTRLEWIQQLGDVSQEDWDMMMAVNCRSTFFACSRVSQIMRTAGGGNLVLLGSVDAAKLVPSPVHFAASQAALRGMTQSMSKELGQFDIRVNLVASGILESGMSTIIPARLHEMYLKHCGLRRVGKVAEVASVVVWLAMENTYVTGQTIVVDGAL